MAGWHSVISHECDLPSPGFHAGTSRQALKHGFLAGGLQSKSHALAQTSRKRKLIQRDSAAGIPWPGEPNRSPARRVTLDCDMTTTRNVSE